MRAALGCEDGETDGVAVGVDAVGDVDGSAVVEGAGASVLGAYDGSELGPTVGRAEGAGSAVGSAVGEADGPLGTADGDTLLGSLLGMTLGLMMGLSRPIADILGPFVHTLRFIGPIAWISAVMMWFGLGETSKVVLIVYTTTFVVLISTMIGVMTIHPNKLRAARVFGARGFRLFAHVTLPAALPHVLTGARLAMMNSFMTIIAAEMVAAREGLGFLIFNSRQWMEVDAIFVGMITLGLLGLLADRLMVLLTRVLFRRFRPAEA